MPVKSKVEISQNFVTSEYMNFKIKTFQIVRLKLPFIFSYFYFIVFHRLLLKSTEYWRVCTKRERSTWYWCLWLYQHLQCNPCLQNTGMYFLNPYPTLKFIKKLESKPRPFYPVLQINLLMPSFLEATVFPNFEPMIIEHCLSAVHFDWLKVWKASAPLLPKNLYQSPK